MGDSPPRTQRAPQSADPQMADPQMADPQVAGLLLAAGLGRRFGGAKLAAPLDGRPLVAHILDTLRDAVDDGTLARGLVVAASDRSALGDVRVVRGAAQGLGLEVVTNDAPEDGLSGSLQVGLKALEAMPVDAVLVLLADQPRTPPGVLSAMVAEWRRTAAPIVVPRYGGAGGAPGNPVLLARAVWPIAGTLRGDSGMSAVARQRPDLVAYLDVEGANPDVDRPEDLEGLSGHPG
jgi:molybdenum cofactor cytidylyltransferase